MLINEVNLMTEKQNSNYMDNEEVYIDICVWKLKVYAFGKDEKFKKYTKIPDSVGDAIMKTSEGVSRLQRYRGYSYLDEMIADGILAIVNGINNFNEKRFTNPHNYFTTAVVNAFLQRIEKEKISRLAMLNGNYDEIYFSHVGQENNFDIDEETIEELNQKRSGIIKTIERKKKRKKTQKQLREVTPLSMFLTGGEIKEVLEKELQKTETFYNNTEKIMGENGSMMISVDRIKQGLGIELGTICVGDVIEYLKEIRNYPIDDESMVHGVSKLEISFVELETKDFVLIRWDDEEDYGY